MAQTGDIVVKLEITNELRDTLDGLKARLERVSNDFERQRLNDLVKLQGQQLDKQGAHIRAQDDQLRLQGEQIKSLREACMQLQHTMLKHLREQAAVEGSAVLPIRDMVYGQDYLFGLGYARWPGEGVQESVSGRHRTGQTSGNGGL